MMINKELVEILACPVCKGEVKETDGKIVCLKCKRRYPIREGVPIMLEREATIESKERE